MKFKSILAAIAILACGTVSAQNVTKADFSKLENQLNALSSKVSQLETNLERVITENVNLVEQLNIKTVTSVTDNNGIQWDIVKIEPNTDKNSVTVTLRVSNNTGNKVQTWLRSAYALDSNSNLSDNKYKVSWPTAPVVDNGVPLNFVITIKDVPSTCSYIALINIQYALSASSSKETSLKFTGVHIPW